MIEKNDGGPAFPVQSAEWQGHGMLLRDYFAAKAMVMFNSNVNFEQVAEWSYMMADAMLKAREQ